MLQEAIDKNINLILVHHPVIFSGLKRIIDTDNSLVYSLIANGIALYATHTNFDMIEDGLNDYFAKLLGATKITSIEDHENCRLLRIFEVPSISGVQFAKKIKSSLELDSIRAVGDLQKEISSVGLVTGAGFDYAELAIQNGADIYISGDLKYHQAMELKEKGILALDVGHFETEKIFAEAMESFIKKNIPELNTMKLFVSENEVAPIEFV